MQDHMVTTPLKFGYGVGQLSEGIKSTAFSTFLFFYYNQVLGLSGSLAGSAALIALIIDAVTDPMVGQLSDRFRSRWGRRHPFMLAGAIPFAFALFALFSPPEGLQTISLFAWMLGWAVIVRILFTLFCVPHYSLGAEMARDYHGRTALISYRVFFSFLGGILASAGGFAFFFPPSEAFPNGMLNAASYPMFGLTAGALGSAAMLASIYSTRSTIAHLTVPNSKQNQRSALFALGAVVRALRLQSFRLLFMSAIVFMSIAGVTLTLSVYIGTYNYGFAPELLSVISTSPIVGVLFAPAVASKLSQRLDKKQALAYCVCLGAVISTFPLMLYLADVFQGFSLAQRFGLAFVCMGVGQVFFIAYIIVFDSMVTDTIDEHELVTGEREEGLFFAARALAQKASSGVGSFMAGIALDTISFPRSASASDVPQAALDGLAIIGGPVCLLFFVGTLYFSNRYQLNEQRHGEIMCEIEKRS